MKELSRIDVAKKLLELEKFIDKISGEELLAKIANAFDLALDSKKDAKYMDMLFKTLMDEHLKDIKKKEKWQSLQKKSKHFKLRLEDKLEITMTSEHWNEFLKLKRGDLVAWKFKGNIPNQSEPAFSSHRYFISKVVSFGENSMTLDDQICVNDNRSSVLDSGFSLSKDSDLVEFIAHSSCNEGSWEDRFPEYFI